MKIEYQHSIKSGHNLIEVLNPANGLIDSVMSIIEFRTDLATKELIITGIDMTLYFSEQKYVGGSFESFQSNLMAHVQKTPATTRRYSSHFPYTTYSE